MARAPSNLAGFKADVVRSLGHPLRIEIVEYLEVRGRSVSEIIGHFEADASVISRQLAILKRAGVLAARKSGLNVFYSVALSCVPEFLRCVGRHISSKKM